MSEALHEPLEAPAVRETVEELYGRIEARFPKRGLLGVCGGSRWLSLCSSFARCREQWCEHGLQSVYERVRFLVALPEVERRAEAFDPKGKSVQPEQPVNGL